MTDNDTDFNLHFVTSVSPSYWNSVGKHCINTWDLPGSITIYIDQQEGDVNWMNDIDIRFRKRLLNVPKLELDDIAEEKTKVRKFWGKACAQIHAVRNRPLNTRVIWLDADIEQLHPVHEDLFNFEFVKEIAVCKSNDYVEDCWESGIVIYNHQAPKVNIFMKAVERVWNNPDELLSLFRPYDAMVTGYVAQERGFYNLCKNDCENIDAISNSRFGKYFKHWINKDNKKLLQELKNNGQG